MDKTGFFLADFDRDPLLDSLFLVDASDFNQTECLAGSTSCAGERIEKLSRVEHDHIKEVHLQVSEIKEGMDTIVAAVKDTKENNFPLS